MRIEPCSVLSFLVVAVPSRPGTHELCADAGTGRFSAGRDRADAIAAGEAEKRINTGQTAVRRQAAADLGKAMAIGYYPRGCLQGGVPLPTTGPTWQVMRLSRNRNWGHPSLIHFLEKFAPAGPPRRTGWKGILVGDLAQPRGGPLPYGHTSHQIGLDVDVWFMPMPDRVLSKDEREKTSATNLVSDDWKHLNPKTWTPQHIAFIKTAAEQPDVERVLVNAVIKQDCAGSRIKIKTAGWRRYGPGTTTTTTSMCRLKCPADSTELSAPSPPVGAKTGCDKEKLTRCSGFS